MFQTGINPATRCTVAGGPATPLTVQPLCFVYVYITPIISRRKR